MSVSWMVGWLFFKPLLLLFSIKKHSRQTIGNGGHCRRRREKKNALHLNPFSFWCVKNFIFFFVAKMCSRCCCRDEFTQKKIRTEN